MKQLMKPGTFKMFVAYLFFTLMQLVVIAQETGGSTEGSSTTTSSSSTKVSVTESQDWYSSPWVWVIGAALFILLLVALLRGGSSRTGTTDRVTVTKSVRTDVDTDPDVV
jgi:hypothetical protein